MSITRVITGALIVAGSLGLGGVAGAGDIAVRPTQPPPPPTAPINEIAVEPTVLEATTCEGHVNCRLLGSVCDAIGGTFTSWPSPTLGHDRHPHGICTWPWE